MRVYIAGSFIRQKELAEQAQLFEQAGFGVTSSWLKEPETSIKERTMWFMQACAAIAKSDVETADALVLYGDVPSTGGGMWVETGIAMARGMDIVTVGDWPFGNVFLHLTQVRHARDTYDAIAALKDVR